MTTVLKENPLPSKAILTASFHEITNPPDPQPIDDIPTPDLYPYLRLGITHSHRTLFFHTDVVSGPIEQTISLSPGESLEATMELTRRITVEEENESKSQVTSETSQEQSSQDELTDRVSSVLQDTHSTSASVSASGSIAIVSGTVGLTDTYTSTQTDSKEQIRRAVRQTSQRVSQQLMKSYVIRSKRTEDTTTRDTYRRLLRNESDRPMHFGFRKTLQLYRAATQYMGPQLIWHVTVNTPGSGLGGPRVVGPRILPAAFVQQAQRMMLVTEHQGFLVSYQSAARPVYYITVPLMNYDDLFVGAQFLNGRKAISFDVILPGLTASFLCKIEHTEPLANGSVKIRFNPIFVSSTSPLPASFDMRLPPFQIISVNRNIRMATDNLAGDTVENFIEIYREYLLECVGVEPRPSGDLRQEERTELLRRALLPFQFAPPYGPVRQAEIKQFEDLFDTKSSFYNLYPPHYDSLGAAYRMTGTGTLPEYDTFRGIPPAKFGASLGWKIQLDADARRTEFINSPLARICIPIVRGREAEAVTFLLRNLPYRLSKNGSDIFDAIENRRVLEKKLADLGGSEMSVDLEKKSERVPEDGAPDDKLAVALYPVTEIFDVTEPLTGFLYEPLEP